MSTTMSPLRSLTVRLLVLRVLKGTCSFAAELTITIPEVHSDTKAEAEVASANVPVVAKERVHFETLSAQHKSKQKEQ